MLSASSLFHRCHLRIDWQGRPYQKFLSPVGNGTAVDGERFAEPGVQAAWDSLGVGMGRLSSAGQRYEYYYDAKGRLIDEVMHDEYLGEYRLLRHHGWSPVGQLTGDTVVFENGLATATRTLSYNRRGQRTGETDVVTVAAGQQLTGDKGGAIRYVYDSLTARLSSIIHLVTTSTGASDTLATVSFLYDRGGRDTLRTVKLKGTSAPVTRSTHYDSHGWVDHIVEKVGANVRYSFDNPVFSALGEIRSADETRRANTGPVRFNYDSTNWTRRLLSGYDGVAGNGSGGDFTQWTYDRFGNRLTELHSLPNTNPDPMQYYTIGSDNRLLAVSDHIDSTKSRRYLTDQAGQRLAVLDRNTGLFGLWGISTWTAAGQLYYSMTPETATGPYDLVWNWYDGSGRRFMTHLATTTTRGSLARPDSTVGFRTYYVYDGNDVAFTLVRPSTGTTWRIQQRYVNTGLDENVAARLWLNGTPTSLALVTDRQGGYIMGVKADGLEETRTGFYLRNAFGKMESGSTAASSMETHTGLGFAGAGTPTAAGGGYVYMRNRWYDPQTGRFLSQDPIGLAGGVNLYAYAGNNPANYSDPYGLTPCCVEALRLAAGAGISIAVAPEVVAGILAVAVISLADQESGRRASTSIVAPVDVTGYALPRRSTRSIRREWEGIHGIPWPVGADGRPHEAHHTQPLADGGVDDATNIEPLPKAEHIQRHKDNGDFKRWAKRRAPRRSEPEQPPQEGGDK